MEDRTITVSLDVARRSVTLPDNYRLQRSDGEIVSYLLGGQNFSYSISPATHALTWGAFGTEFTTLGEVRALAREHPSNAVPAIEDESTDLPVVDEPETVGIELFGNMLDTIAFLRVRLRALADLMIAAGVVTGPELLGSYHEYHERSFQAYRDHMLLRPDIFEQRFSGWLATEQEYRTRLAESSDVGT